MHHAIALSLHEGQKTRLLDDTRQSWAASGQLPMTTPRAREGGKRKEDVRDRSSGKAQRTGSRPDGRPAKAVTSGFGGSNWVDNSDFQGQSGDTGYVGSMPSSITGSVTSGAGVGASRGAGIGSSIVSLPRIQRVAGAEQREMVKDLHDSIAGAILPRRNELLADLDVEIDKPLGRGEGAFNDRFHSCGNSDCLPAVRGHPPRHRSVVPAVGATVAYSSMTPVVPRGRHWSNNA